MFCMDGVQSLGLHTRLYTRLYIKGENTKSIIINKSTEAEICIACAYSVHYVNPQD